MYKAFSFPPSFDFSEWRKGSGDLYQCLGPVGQLEYPVAVNSRYSMFSGDDLLQTPSNHWTLKVFQLNENPIWQTSGSAPTILLPLNLGSNLRCYFY